MILLLSEEEIPKYLCCVVRVSGLRSISDGSTNRAFDIVVDNGRRVFCRPIHTKSYELINKSQGWLHQRHAVQRLQTGKSGSLMYVT